MSEIINVEAVQEENFAELLEQSIKTLNTGDKVIGTVTHIGNTEIQVDLGTKHAGYIPYDEVSADPSVKPEDILHIGDEIEVFVVRVNDQEGTVQLSKKKLNGAFLIVNANNENFDLVANLQDVLGLNRGIGADFVIRDVAGMLGAQIDLDFGVADTGNSAENLISCI